MARELDDACARALGWHTLPGCDALHKGDVCIHDQIPNFSTGCRAARSLEDEIERRGLQLDYTTYLADIVGVHRDSWNDRDALLVVPWLLIRATPEQRCRAFLEAVIA